jgi:hypothetical protein
MFELDFWKLVRALDGRGFTGVNLIIRKSKKQEMWTTSKDGGLTTRKQEDEWQVSTLGRINPIVTSEKWEN